MFLPEGTTHYLRLVYVELEVILYPKAPIGTDYTEILAKAIEDSAKRGLVLPPESFTWSCYPTPEYDGEQEEGQLTEFKEITMRSDNAALESNRKRMNQGKETKKCYEGTWYYGVIVKVEDSIVPHSHNVTMKYDPARCHRNTPYREWKEEK